MKTITRQYPQICNFCNGNKQVADVPNTTSPYRTCPLCNGIGNIIVTETIARDDWLQSVSKIMPKSIY